MLRFAPRCTARLSAYSAMATAARFNGSASNPPKPSKPASGGNTPKPGTEKGTVTLPFCL